MPERNVELLEKTMQYIKDHPEKHQQGTWVNFQADCGTAACFAGWTCLLEGMDLKKLQSPAGTEYLLMPDDSRADEDGDVEIQQVAGDLLGLTGQETNTLFCGINSQPMLELMVKDLVNGDDLRDLYDYRAEAKK